MVPPPGPENPPAIGPTFPVRDLIVDTAPGRVTSDSPVGADVAGVVAAEESDSVPAVGWEPPLPHRLRQHHRSRVESRQY